MALLGFTRFRMVTCVCSEEPVSPRLERLPYDQIVVNLQPRRTFYDHEFIA